MGPAEGGLPTPHGPSTPRRPGCSSGPSGNADAGQLTPGGRGGRPLWLPSWNLRNSLVPPDWSLRDTLRRRRGPAARTDKEHLITGVLSREGGFAIMLQVTGIAIRAQEMHVAAALRDKGYAPFFSSRLAETGATPSREGKASSPRSAASTWESTRCSVSQKTSPGRPRPWRSARTGEASPSSTSTDRRQAAAHGREGRRSGSTYKLKATARSLGGRHSVVIAGDTNIYMDATTNPATEHFRAGWEACGLWRATAGGVEDMTPTLQPSRHRVDTFLVNERLLPWSLPESVWARGMAQPRMVGSDHLPVPLALRGLLNAAGHGAMPSCYSHMEGCLLPYDAEARPSNAACGQGSPPRRMSPPWRPGWAPRSSTPTGPCPRPQWTRCSNTSTQRMTPWHTWWDTGSRPRRGRTWREGTPLRAGIGSRRRSSATTSWQRALRLTEVLRGASPMFRPATQGQLKEELARQAVALEEDIRHLRALLAADGKSAIKDFWRRHAQDIAQRWRALRGAI